jgi:hypothetical protein
MADSTLEQDIAGLVQEVERQAGPEGARWLERELEELGQSFARAHFSGVHAGVARRLRAAGADGAVDTGLVERARAALLRTALSALPESAHVELVREVYRRGDSAERSAVLRTLMLRPTAERVAPIAIEACRSNVQVVFEAVACENPYAARYFPAEAFQQLVLKALFTGVPLARIEGLEARRTPDLARMAAGYASELRAAGRPVSADIEQLANSAPAVETADR